MIEKSYRAGSPQAIAVAGLGAGALLSYSPPGQRWTVYEIDPVVVRIARNKALFSYWSQSAVQPEAMRHAHRLDPEQFAAGSCGGGKCLVQRNIALQHKAQDDRGVDKGDHRRPRSSNNTASDPPERRGAGRSKPKAREGSRTSLPLVSSRGAKRATG
jgi:hypothetical protein